MKRNFSVFFALWPCLSFVSYRQFHQHFIQAFFVWKFVLSLPLSRENLPKRLLYKKRTHKILMKLRGCLSPQAPPGPLWVHLQNLWILIVKLVSSVYGAITGQKSDKGPQFTNSNFTTTAHGGGSAVGYLQGVNVINILLEPFLNKSAFLPKHN